MRIHEFFIHLPRHPLLRALALIAGTVLLIALLAMGLLIGAAVIAAAALTMLLRRWLKGRERRHRDPGVIEGEFTVMPRAPLPPTEQASTRSGW
jgi:membrane protein implicated in regulation of membrane protease activity